MQMPEKLSAIAFEDRRIARYARLSTVEQSQGQSFDRQFFDIDCAVEEIAPVLLDLAYSDLESGRNVNRSDYQRMLGDLKVGRLDGIAIDRIDRINRGIGENDRLWQEFAKLDVALLIVSWGSFVDWESLEDWKRFTNDSVEGEHYSRRLSSLLKRANKYGRSKHKPPPGKPPFGYRRDGDRYALDYDCLEQSAGSVKAFFDAGSYRGGARLANELHGTKWQPASYQRWLNHPVLRGHTQYFRGSTDKRTPVLVLDTHPDAVLLSEDQYRRMKMIALAAPPLNGKRARHPYSGICVCGICGMSAVKFSWKAKSGRRNEYLTCRAYRDRVPGTVCGEQEERSRQAIRIEVVEEAVINALASRAQDLVEFAISTEPTGDFVDPETVKLREQLMRLEALKKDGVPGLDGAIAEIKRKLTMDKNNRVASVLEPDLLRAMATKEYWMAFVEMDPLKKRALISTLVVRVSVVDRNVEEIVLAF